MVFSDLLVLFYITWNQLAQFFNTKLVRSRHFIPSPCFIPSPQSVVRSPHSSVYTDRTVQYREMSRLHRSVGVV